MWINVRSMDGGEFVRIDNLSRITKIENLRKLLVEKFDTPVDRQRLFYRGKQLEDGHTLFDYNVGLNDTIQILIKQPVLDESSKIHERLPLANHPNSSTSDAENHVATGHSSSATDKAFEMKHVKSKYFKVGDIVDAKDSSYGAWYEATITEITISDASETSQNCKTETTDVKPDSKDLSFENKENDSIIDDLLYHISFVDSTLEPVKVRLNSVRPRAKKVVKFEEINVGELYMVNYNDNHPHERGLWYDCIITSKVKKDSRKELIGSVISGPEEIVIENCKIKFINEVYAIEKNNPMTDETQSNCEPTPVLREKMPNCKHCKDNPARKCKICSCGICGGKDSPEKQILCDECDLPYHIWCLTPPLEDIPQDDEWYCPECKNDETEVVRAGEKLKTSKKKSKLASANTSSTRDWGKGMACAGKTKSCTIVSSNHFGPIPGVEVGTMWKFRLQVSESGIHRPHVAGIHGRENDGAYSIVLSGGYEDDLDEGDEFKYTGSGGRDLSGNKRCAEQSCDQKLTRMNKALAINCAAPFNDKTGAEAKQWKEGKPVRVVRNFKGRKHSKYCPEDGNRYDGIYKIVKYWPEKGKSGFLVWRYLLRRDDPSPAPWTKQGKKRIEELGLTLQVPDGYQEDKDKTKQKRPRSDDDDESTPKRKIVAYKLPADIKKLIKNDSQNNILWKECIEVTDKGYKEFLSKVEESFKCICCQEVVYNPVTTVCCHNICKACLVQSFKAEVYNCPMCRHVLGKNYEFKINKFLQDVLLKLFPGYEAGR